MKKSLAIRKIQEQIGKIDGLKGCRANSDHAVWLRETEIALEYVFGNDTRHIKEFKKISYSPAVLVSGGGNGFQRSYENGLQRAEKILSAMADEVQEYWEADRPVEGSQDASSKERGSKIFIVHGHDVGMKESVAKFLKQLGLMPIILHEQPNEGKTIIEKFEKHSEVSFALVLLTADDKGASKENLDVLNSRARQNVILEFGYFLGKLGRKNVVALYEKSVEMPSDYDGVIFVPLDQGDAWRLEVIKELKAAGFDVDANAIL